MKKFIAYTIKHAENNGNIERRYKQFDWLDQRLTEQFPCSLRPQLPEKQASGRFEHEFIERRKVCQSERSLKQTVILTVGGTTLDFII